jgi:uncharacterized protein (DUF1810 family)
MEKIEQEKNDLQRFLTAQDGKRGDYTLYELALKEIQEGKLGFECWVRYVYPQLKRKGTSPLTDFYGLNGREEANAYIEHPVLKERLIAAAQVLLDNDKPLNTIFSNLGRLKLRSCMLLFASVSDEPIFKKVIIKYGWK